MKILFICGSLEPSKDGVGDYTRRLAGELIRQGNSCAIVAITDKGVHESFEEFQQSDISSVPVLRLSFYNGYNANCLQAKPWIDDFNPDWISLQYVPFSFHSKGMPFGLGGALHPLILDRKLHLMFHELWVGVNNKPKSIRSRIFGLIQKLIINKTINLLKPQIIHTSIKIYKEALGRNNAQILPLFGNIPISCDVAIAEDQEKMRQENYFKVVHFGTFTADVNEFINQIKWLDQFCEKNQLKFQLNIVGRGGPFKNEIVSLINQFIDLSEIIDHGVVSDNLISAIIHNCDMGISRADYDLYGKSGTTIAMIEHGLPVLLKGKKPVIFFQDDYPKSIFFTDDQPLNIPEKNSPNSFLHSSASKFYNSLNII